MIYENAGEIDFFRSIGVLPVQALKNLWYCDRGGNTSKYGDHLISDLDEKIWHRQYWDNFYRDITTKTQNWAYEDEKRLILTSMLDDLNEVRKRTLTYDIRSLKGIIFGINTYDADKLRTMEVIDRKIQEGNLDDFKFYQAYYCSKRGNIQKREMSYVKLT